MRNLALPDRRVTCLARVRSTGAASLAGSFARWASKPRISTPRTAAIASLAVGETAMRTIRHVLTNDGMALAHGQGLFLHHSTARAERALREFMDFRIIPASDMAAADQGN